MFLLHRDDPSLPVAAWADALQEQVAAGTIGAFGVSNWTVDRLRALHREVDGGPLRAFSNHFSLADMVSPPWPDCLAVTAAELRSLAGAGPDGDHVVEPRDRVLRRPRRRRLGQRPQPRAPRRAPATSRAISARRRRRSRSPTCSPSPSTCWPAVGTTSGAHLEDAFAATELSLTPEQLAWLET